MAASMRNKNVNEEKDKIDDGLLIELVQSRRELWERRSAIYRKESMRCTAWKEISSQLNATEGTVRKRWKELRDMYVRELRRQKRSNNEDTPINKDSSDLYLAMTFLAGSIIHRKKFALKNGTDTSEENTQIAEVNIADDFDDATVSFDEEYVQPSIKNERSVPARKSLDLELDQHTPDPIEQAILEHLQNTRRTEAKDHVQLFLDTLVEPMRRLTPKQFALAKIKIDSVMYEITYESTEPPM